MPRTRPNAKVPTLFPTIFWGFFCVTIIGMRNWKKELLYLAVLVLVFLPVYLYKIYSVPWQINTDEITIMLVMKKLLADNVSIFGVSYYFGFPSFIFIALGKVAELLGGVTLYHVRVIHSLFGVGIIALSYVLFRLFFTRTQGLLLAILLGLNHSLLAISRMAMRDNTGLFFELLALVPLLYGYKKQSIRWVFTGGLLSGLTFYTYFPSRITIFIWFGFLVLALVQHFSLSKLKQTLKLFAVSLLGCGLVAAPVLFATVSDKSLALTYSRQQFLFYPEGQKLQQEWSATTNAMAAFLANIKNGLLTFNTPIHDHGYIYPNYGHGFVDPIIGVLLWVGVCIVLVRLFQRRAAEGDVLALVGFSSLYILYAFVITKAPNYTRLLVLLPFVVYLAGRGLFALTGGVTVLFHAKLVGYVFVFALVAGIILFNIEAFGDFARKGLTEGNDVGSTARFVELQKSKPNHAWVLAADKTNMYYSWGDTWQWQDWLGFFAGPTQKTMVISPTELASRSFNPNVTVFMSSAVWSNYQSAFRRNNPFFTVTNVTPGGSLVAIELQTKK